MGHAKYLHVFTGEGFEKLVIRCVRIKWMAANKFRGVLFVHWFGQVHYSITSSQESVVYFHDNYDCFILCDD